MKLDEAELYLLASSFDETTLPDEGASNGSKDTGDENKSDKSFENSGASNHGPVKIEPAFDDIL